tara:strand:- start:6397 stop:6630 length:234 start_codon:yes stop_codon:yes gene_type:complete
MFGIWTKLKYHSKPIHIIPTTTWINLNNQLQKRVSISNPPFRKYRIKNNTTVKTNEKWIVLDSDCKIPLIGILYNES